MVEGFVFKPHIGLNGFQIRSEFDVDSFACSSLNSAIGQMGIILYPAELLNEKLLIKIRDCMINLKTDHPIKKWVLAVSQTNDSKPEISNQSFLIEMINSKFNLITDQNIKEKVISIIGGLEESTLQKIILKSYLYLMVGNITRSDNLLLKVVRIPPKKFYTWKSFKNDVIDDIVKSNLEKILEKFSRHPADRVIFNLFAEYLKTYTNQKDLIQILNDNSDTSDLEDKLELRYLNQKAPELCQFLNLKKLKNEVYQAQLQDIKNYPAEFQINWIWPYLGFPVFYNKEHLKVLFDQDKSDHLWTLYLLGDEKLSEIYASNSIGKTLSQQRQFLRGLLKDDNKFMLALYKLIEMGDVDESLVQETSNYFFR